MFLKVVKTIQLGFDDPSGKAAVAYEKTLDLIENELLPRIKEELCRS